MKAKLSIIKEMYYAEIFENHDIVGEHLVEARFFSEYYDARKFCLSFNPDECDFIWEFRRSKREDSLLDQDGYSTEQTLKRIET